MPVLLQSASVLVDEQLLTSSTFIVSGVKQTSSVDTNWLYDGGNEHNMDAIFSFTVGSSPQFRIQSIKFDM